MKVRLLLVLFLFSCAPAANLQRGEEFRGYYQAGFEVEAFEPCGSPEKWWVVRGDELNARYRQFVGAPYEPVFIVVRGQVGPRGRYGHLGLYNRELVVQQVLEIRPLSEADCL